MNLILYMNVMLTAISLLRPKYFNSKILVSVKCVPQQKLADPVVVEPERRFQSRSKGFSCFCRRSFNSACIFVISVFFELLSKLNYVANIGQKLFELEIRKFFAGKPVLRFLRPLLF